MGTSWNLERLAEAFAEAAVDSARWNATMEIVAESAGGFGAALFPVRGPIPQVPYSPSLEPAFDSYVRDGWIDRDERYRTEARIERRGVATDLDFTTINEMRRHPYYEEFLAPHGLRWFAGVKVACGKDFWTLSIQRSNAQGPFDEAEQVLLATLSKQLSGAAALARALNFARAEGAMSAFEATETAVVLLDVRREILRANEAAEQLLGPDLKIIRRRIVSSDQAATATLDKALHALLWTRSSSALMAPVILPREGKRSVLAYPLRMSAVAGEPLADCQAMLVLVDLERQELPPAARLRACFGLTPAEARLAQHMSSGKNMEDTAEELGVAKGTARSQLKAVFAKTQTQRQSELISLLNRLCQPSARH